MGWRVPDWREADAVARAVERDMVAALAAGPHADRVVVAGVPDGVGTDLWPAYVFNNGLREAAGRRLRAAGVAWDGEVELVEGPQRPWPLAYTAAGGPALPAAALDSAAATPGTLVLVYDGERPGLNPWEDPRE